MFRISSSVLVGVVTAAVLLSAGGCNALPGGNDRDGLKLAEPSPAFVKKVERDPFPRANTASPAAK